VFFNRRFYSRALRTKFYPKVSNMFSAYVIRLDNPAGRYWITTIGNKPSSDDREFVDHRVSFISDLVEFNELQEARALRTQMLNTMSGNHKPGEKVKYDLAPDYDALEACVKKLHKELEL
jgi:hypothetical protein